MTQFAKETLPISLEEEMRRSYLDYAMSVIVGRAAGAVASGAGPSRGGPPGVSGGAPRWPQQTPKC